MYQTIISCPDDQDLYQALKPEENQDKRGSLKLKKKKGALEIHIQAKDAVALRALLVSIARLISIYEEVKNDRKKS